MPCWLSRHLVQQLRSQLASSPLRRTKRSTTSVQPGAIPPLMTKVMAWLVSDGRDHPLFPSSAPLFLLSSPLCTKHTPFLLGASSFPVSRCFAGAKLNQDSNQGEAKSALFCRSASSWWIGKQRLCIPTKPLLCSTVWFCSKNGRLRHCCKAASANWHQQS